MVRIVRNCVEAGLDGLLDHALHFFLGTRISLIFLNDLLLWLCRRIKFSFGSGIDLFSRYRRGFLLDSGLGFELLSGRGFESFDSCRGVLLRSGRSRSRRG